MLFNCFNCCKAISSNTTSCPYCRIETTTMAQQMGQDKAIAAKERRWGFLLKRSAYKAERKAKELASGLVNIPQIVHQKRA